MTDTEKQAKVAELQAEEDKLSASIKVIESSYKETSEQKALTTVLSITADENVIKAIYARLATFKNDNLTGDELIKVCLSHDFTLPEVVKNGLSKIRGGYMFRRKTLSKELRSSPKTPDNTITNSKADKAIED